MSLIAISGKIGSGKDTIGSIIKWLTSPKVRVYYNDDFNKYLANGGLESDNWFVQKFADKLKDMICLLTNCTREQLEDADFKNQELGEEWKVWFWSHYRLKGHSTHGRLGKLHNTKEEAEEEKLKWSPNFEDGQVESYVLTRRLLLQLLGTECGRQIIHPNIWINALFSKYVPQTHSGITRDLKLPNWIITDMRFPNELEAVKNRGGITIRVDRPVELRYPELWKEYQSSEYDEWDAFLDFKQIKGNIYHESETALDNAGFDYIIDNSGSINTLIYLVKEILIKEKIIKDDEVQTN